MKIKQEELAFQSDNKLICELFTEDSIFFDIETTGFAPSHTQLYLIGCVRRRGEHLCLNQFFAEKPEDEPLVLTAFFELLAQYKTIISYNGIGFDIPYLKAKCEQYAIPENFFAYTYVDLFKSVSKIKHVLKLENYKQKTIEEFLKIDRKDLYSGGELINIYKSYVKDPDEELLLLLLLHNYEDVLGMIDLLSVLSYTHLFHGDFLEIAEVREETGKKYDGSSKTELIITIIPEYPFPQRISCRFGGFYLSLHDKKAQLVIPVCEEALKYFYPNPKDYYYLPAEDTAIHKSVAAYVDKEHREQAKRANCYTKKNSHFLPQWDKFELFTPAFYQNYGDKISYFEYTPEFTANSEYMSKYVKYILQMLGDLNKSKICP